MAQTGRRPRDPVTGPPGEGPELPPAVNQQPTSRSVPPAAPTGPGPSERTRSLPPDPANGPSDDGWVPV